MTKDIEEFIDIFIKLFTNNFDFDGILYNKKEVAILNRFYIYKYGYYYNINLDTLPDDISLLTYRYLLLGFDDQYYHMNYYYYLQRGNDTYIPSPNEMKTPDEFLKTILIPILKPTKPHQELNIIYGSVVDAFDFTNIETGNTTQPIDISIGIVIIIHKICIISSYHHIIISSYHHIIISSYHHIRHIRSFINRYA